MRVAEVVTRGMQRMATIVAVAMIPVTVSAQIKIIPQQKIAQAENPSTVADAGMVFPSGERLNFGTIEEMGGAWSGEILWRNKGREPLVITRITTTCGCLQVKAERQVVAVGEEGLFKVTYLPKGHPGRVRQRAFVYTNLSEQTPTAILHVEGFVKAAIDRSDDYPYSRGALLLRRDGATVGRQKGSMQRIACMNEGTTPLTIKADSLFTPKSISLYTEPRVLAPGEEGDLIIEYDPTQENRWSADAHRIKIILDGIALPPRERTLEITIEEKIK